MFSFRKVLAVSSILAAAMFAGCSEDGKPMAHATFSFDTALVTADKTATGTTFTASNGDQVRIDSLVVEIESLELISSATTSGTAAEFDPNNPPAPFTNCHGDHCHSTESDATYSFDEIKKILADKASGKSVVFAADVEKTATLKGLNTTVSLANVAEGDLDEATLSEFRVKLGEIHFKGHNLTTDTAIDINNSHTHEDGDEDDDHDHEDADHDHDHEEDGHDHEHEHIDVVSLSRDLSLTINAKSDYEQEFKGVIEIDAAFIDEIVTATDDIDFADVIADHATLK